MWIRILLKLNLSYVKFKFKIACWIPAQTPSAGATQILFLADNEKYGDCLIIS